MQLLIRVILLQLLSLLLVNKTNGQADSTTNSSTGDRRNGKKHGEWTTTAKNGNLLLRATYYEGILNGAVTFYDTITGKIVSKGVYVNEKKHGEWEYYHNGLLIQSVTYMHGDKNGSFIYYDSTTGVKQMTGRFINDKLSGLVMQYKKDGLLPLSKISFINGRKEGNARFYDSIVNIMSHTGEYYMNLKSGTWKYYYKDGNTLKEEHQYKDDKLNGTVKIYDSASGLVVFEINYVNNKKEGKTTGYYIGSNTKKFQCIYKNDLLDGPAEEYYTTGKLSIQGVYKKDYKTGTWTSYSQYNNAVWFTLEYNKGMVDGKLISFHSDGKISRNAKFKNGRLISSTCFDQNGMEITCADFISYPSFREDIMNFIGRHLTYSKTMKENKYEGKVLVRFRITRYGDVDNISIVEGLNKECNEEAIRVVSLMNGWSPLKIEGVPIETYETVPIVFWHQSE